MILKNFHCINSAYVSKEAHPLFGILEVEKAFVKSQEKQAFTAGVGVFVSHFDYTGTSDTFSFSLLDRGAIFSAGGPCALYGVSAFALAGSLCVTQPERQQSR